MTIVAPGEPLRILVVGETWHGSNSDAFAQAFRRDGHSVAVIAESSYAAAGWRSTALKIVRRAVGRQIVQEMTSAVQAAAADLQPHLLFTMKGFMLTPSALKAVHDQGGVAINFWPDTSVVDHGYWPTVTLPFYDWIFTAKSFGIADIERVLGARNVSFMHHGYESTLHQPVNVFSEWDRSRYGCDVGFVGSWSPKKQKLLERLKRDVPEASLKIWGDRWAGMGDSPLRENCAFRGVFSAEYTKAIAAAKISLGLLFEGNRNAPQGDLTTTRTFEIPAIGSFMLHERNEEVRGYFEEDLECAMFGDPEEMTAKIRHYLAHDEERRRIAEAGHRRAASGYSIDNRAEKVIAKARELLAAGRGAAA